jgi:hypothetical protein
MGLPRPGASFSAPTDTRNNQAWDLQALTNIRAEPTDHRVRSHSWAKSVPDGTKTSGRAVGRRWCFDDRYRSGRVQLENFCLAFDGCRRLANTSPGAIGTLFQTALGTMFTRRQLLYFGTRTPPSMARPASCTGIGFAGLTRCSTTSSRNSAFGSPESCVCRSRILLGTQAYRMDFSSILPPHVSWDHSRRNWISTFSWVGRPDRRATPRSSTIAEPWCGGHSPSPAF